MRSPVKAAAPPLLLALLLTGCATGNGGEPDGDGGTETAESTADASAETTEVVAETAWPYQNRNGEAEVQIHALRVRGELMQLTATVTAEQTGDRSGDSLYRLYGYMGVQPYLVDTANLARYNVVRDSGGTLQAPDAGNTHLTYGEPRDLSFTFAAPPEDVTAMDLYVGELPPVTDVPVLR
ncbi:hypothetical protein [Marinactinospora rubrisoli]|uniref:DUF4352 domain-containing protein n=1 Tax=Marinactinospora rubrisoli TaxID=2715399 RepID=A0ABW2KGR0_9ACTN